MKQQQQPQQASAKKTAAPFSSMPGVAGRDGATLGDIRIHEGAIATIVKRMATSVDGVSRLSGSSIVDSFADLLGNKRMQERSISVQMSEDSVSVELSVNVFFDAKIPVVASEVQKKVSAAIAELTGLKVTAVHVNVREMEERPAQQETE